MINKKYIVYDDLSEMYVSHFDWSDCFQLMKLKGFAEKFNTIDETMLFISDYRNKKWTKDEEQNGRLRKMALRPIKTMVIE